MMLQEFTVFSKNILSWIYAFLIAFVCFFALGLKEVVFLGMNFVLPLPTFNSFSTIFFRRIQQDLLGEGVELIVVNPLNAFGAQIGISMFLAFVFTLPFLLYKLAAYVAPALYEHERKIIFRTLIPLMILFIAGCLFSYFVLIPATFKFLYFYATAVGATTFFAINEFVSLVLLLTTAIGLMFTFPIFMVLLSYVGIVDNNFWRRNWRYVGLSLLIFSAIITPDGSGATMIMLFFPLTTLYFFGLFGSQKIAKKGRNNRVNV